jgi:hypothetical protein
MIIQLSRILLALRMKIWRLSRVMPVIEVLLTYRSRAPVRATAIFTTLAVEKSSWDFKQWIQRFTKDARDTYID